MPFGLKYDSIENYLKSYGKYIVRQARGILKSKGKDTTGKLSGSLKYKVTKDKEGFKKAFKEDLKAIETTKKELHAEAVDQYYNKIKLDLYITLFLY